MIRVATIFLCLILASAAAGRYRAEVSVREMRAEIASLKDEAVREKRSIKVLRAEIAYLENPDRLSKLAAAKTDLRPSSRGQTLTAAQFASALGYEALDMQDGDGPDPSDIIMHAIAMAEYSSESAERVYE